jgi:hypothetical protein
MEIAVNTLLVLSMLIVSTSVSTAIGEAQDFQPGDTTKIGPSNPVGATQDAKWTGANYAEVLSQQVSLQQHRDPRSGNYDGIEITHVVPGSPVEKLGVQVGDVVKSINGHTVHSTQEAISFVKQNEGNYTTWEVGVENNGKKRTITYEPPHAVTTVDLFPPATAGITIQADPLFDPSTSMSLEDLVLGLERVTGVHFLIAADTANILSKRPTGLTHTLEVPADRVWNVAEAILFANGFVLSFVSDEEPKLLSIQSQQSNQPQALRMRARYVPREDLRAWAGHPAFLVQTAICLDSMDVRTLANSIRTMFPDANTQHTLPGGDSNSLILVGFAHQVASFADMLDQINDGKRKRLAQEAKNPPSPPHEPAKPAGK